MAINSFVAEVTFKAWILLQINNKRNDKRLNNRTYSLFFVMAIFVKHLWLIPNKLKWQDCQIFTRLVPFQTPSQSPSPEVFCKKMCSLKFVKF